MWNRNFLMVILGQGISLFANNILYFALSLYILDITGSASLFGLITALSVIPTILLMPVGGVIADRVNKRNVMIIIDLLTGLIILVSFPFLFSQYALYAITILLLSLSMIEIFYTPCVQASIPLIQKNDYLIKSNAISNQIAYVTNIIGPLLGGVLYSYFGITSIIVCSVISFFASSVMEVWIRIPVVEISNRGNSSPIKVMIDDLKEAVDFLVENKSIFRLILAGTVINFSIVPFVTLGLPYFIRTIFNLPSEVYGVASAFLTASAIIGGFIATVFGNKITSKGLYYILLSMSVCLIPIAITFAFNMNDILLYVIVGCLAFEQMLNNIFNICENSMFQMKTPNHLLGKVMSFIVAIAICGDPLSRAIFGPLFDLLQNNIQYLAIAVTLVAIISTVSAKKAFKVLDDCTRRL